MGQYAENTQVAPDRSRAEIERTLARYGASSFMYGWEASQAVLGFVADDRRVKFVLPLPDRKSAEFTKTPTVTMTSADSMLTHSRADMTIRYTFDNPRTSSQ